MMKKMIWIPLTAALAALSASATVFYSEDFEPLPGTATVKASDGKIRFGGNAAGQPSISSNEYAIGTITDGTGVKVEDDGSGTNNVLFVDGRYDKTYGGAVVIDPSGFGDTSSTARLSFDLTYYNRNSDGTNCNVKIYKASGYDLTGATDAKIVMDLKNGVHTPTTVAGVNGAASATLLTSASFDHTTALGTIDVDFTYPGESNAVVIVWESQFKSEFMIDNVQIASVIPALEGDPAVVMFGGLASVFDNGAETNNAFVSQIGAGEIVQFNGVNSDGGSFGTGGTLVNQGVGASLTNSLNDLVLTTTALSSSNASRTNTVSSGGQLGVNASGAAANFQQSDATEWTFEFNKQVDLKQVIFAGMDAAAKDRMRVTVDGVNYDLSPADTDETAAWSGNLKTEVYTFPTSITVAAGADITIATHDDQSTVDPDNNKWGLFGVVVEVPELIETLSIVNFGGNPDETTNAVYMSEVGGDALVAWWGGDDDGRFLGDVGTLKDQDAGATLTSVKFDVTITSLVISSTNAAGTNTFVSGGSLGVTGGDNAKLDSANDEGWTLEFDKDVYLWKVGLKGFTGGLEVADIIIGGDTNTIVPGDCVAATSESGLNIYTFADPVFIAAGTDVEIDAPGGQWGVGNLIIGIDADPILPPETTPYEDWLADYPTIGSETNFTDNPDGDALDNLSEYALGGNPTDPDDQGSTPVFQTLENGGTNVFDYVYFKRTDAIARGLIYEVKLSDSLTPVAWTNTGYTVIDGTVSGDFQSITNRVPLVDDQKFIQLRIELQ